MLKKYSACFLLLVCALALGQSTPAPDQWIAIHAGHLFDGSDKLAADQVILIKGDRIQERTEMSDYIRCQPI